MAWSLTDWALMMIWKRTGTTRPLDDERLCDIDASSDSSGGSDYSCETVDNVFDLV